MAMGYLFLASMILTEKPTCPSSTSVLLMAHSHVGQMNKILRVRDLAVGGWDNDLSGMGRLGLNFKGLASSGDVWEVRERVSARKETEAYALREHRNRAVGFRWTGEKSSDDRRLVMRGGGEERSRAKNSLKKRRKKRRYWGGQKEDGGKGGKSEDEGRKDEGDEDEAVDQDLFDGSSEEESGGRRKRHKPRECANLVLPLEPLNPPPTSALFESTLSSICSPFPLFLFLPLRFSLKCSDLREIHFRSGETGKWSIAAFCHLCATAARSLMQRSI